ncbi:ATP/GTP-binding protein [Actinoallomurus sp. NBC_01490]|uniref:GTP-binding protein n=1 Tax=Actinoallomurus sp. NBC_01490 TaxID=2903557 RepID=UPI002E3769CC|nr:ATP/GTP-binding protein [Actinoallomurus sp. NBC_01490]
MAYTHSDRPVIQAKIMIGGGFGVGKTTAVGAVSEIEPLSTEELLTAASVTTDCLDGVEDKSHTTVALDWGRITIHTGLVLYLFGTPGQERYWFMWDELCLGALGAIVLADTRRLQACFQAIDFFERRRIPFIVAVNEFDGADRYGTEEVRAALRLATGVPVLACDARKRHSVKHVLITLVEYVLTTRSHAG